MSNSHYLQLQDVHDILIDRIELNAGIATGRMSRWNLVAGSLKYAACDEGHSLRFKLSNEQTPSNHVELIVRELRGEFLLRGDFWADEDDESVCPVFLSKGSMILIYDDENESLYLYMDGRAG